MELRQATTRELREELNHRMREIRARHWKKCRNCGRNVEDQGDVGTSWKHVATGSAYCDTRKAAV